MQHVHPHISYSGGPEPLYKSMGDCFKRVIDKQGPLSLWNGNTVDIVGTFYKQYLNFMLKNTYKKELYHLYGHPVDNKLTMFFFNSLSGALTGTTVMLVTYPFDMARIRIAADLAPEKHRLFKTTLGTWKYLY